MFTKSAEFYDAVYSFKNYAVEAGTPEGIEYFTERHELRLFSHEDYLQAFHAAGLETHHDPQGLTGRGLYVGVKSDKC